MGACIKNEGDDVSPVRYSISHQVSDFQRENAKDPNLGPSIDLGHGPAVHVNLPVFIKSESTGGTRFVACGCFFYRLNDPNTRHAGSPLPLIS